MTAFGIGFTGGAPDHDPAAAVGEIRLGDFAEVFHAPIGYWSERDYEASWVAGLHRVLADEGISCLVTAMTDPEVTNFVRVWPLYRVDRVVYVQNRILFLEELGGRFDPAAPWDSLDPRSTVSEDGDSISEWSITTADIEEFLTHGPLHRREA